MSNSLEIIRAISQIIGGIGTFGAVIWAIYIFNRNRRDSEAAKFRLDIIALNNRFDEMMAVFQAHIVMTVKKLMNCDNSATKKMYDKVLAIIIEPNEQEVKKQSEKIQEELSEWVLYSLDRDDLIQGMQPTMQCYTMLQSIRGFLPIMYEFIDTLGYVIFSTYKDELHVNTIRKYVTDSIKLLWKMNQDKTPTINNPDTLQLAWRDIVSQNMNLYRRGISFTDVFNDAGKILKMYTELYLKTNNHALWKSHKKELKTDKAMFESTKRSEKLIKIVTWKLGKRDPELLVRIVQQVAVFGSKIDRDNS